MVAALGKTLARQGHKVGVVTPLYGPILQKAGELGLERMDWNLTLMLDWRTVQGSVWYLNKDGQDIYFIGDGAGKAGNIVVAAATGLVAARDILEKEKW